MDLIKKLKRKKYICAIVLLFGFFIFFSYNKSTNWVINLLGGLAFFYGFCLYEAAIYEEGYVKGYDKGYEDKEDSHPYWEIKDSNLIPRDII